MAARVFYGALRPVFGRLLWQCGHQHPTPAQAAACARARIRNGEVPVRGEDR